MLLLALPKITVWHMLPVALGLHGLVFFIPVPSSDPTVEKPEPDRVNVVNLPKSPSPRAASPTPKAQITPKPSITPKPIVQKPAPTIVTPRPSPVTIQTPITTPSPSPSPTVTPSIAPSPTVTPSPTDVLQISGSEPGCNGRSGCWRMAETKGRLVAGTLEQQLQSQGYSVTQKELDDDTGMRVFEVSKDGSRQYYLHLIWSDRGTIYVRNPELMSRSELEAAAGL